jgi:hypothetical protein
MPDVFVSKKTSQLKNSLLSTKGNPMGFLNAFIEYPLGVRFANQEADEQIVLFLRRHFITNVPWITITLLLLIAPFILIPIATFVIELPFTLPANLTVLLLLFYYLIVFGYAFINFLHWFYNIGIVTQKNIIDIDYSEIVNVHVAATKVTQLEDVSYKQSGFFKTLFNYGDVFLQTAGNLPNFEFLRVPNPGKAVDIIHDLIGT